MWARIKRFFSKLRRWFWGILKTLFEGTTDYFVADLLILALEVVTNLMYSDLSNSA